MKMKRSLLVLSSLLMIGMACSALGQSVINITFGNYTENFDSMGTGSSPTYPTGWAGWKINGSGSLANGTIVNSSTVPGFATSNGSNNTGTIFNFGLLSNSNRSLGSLASGSFIGAFGASFFNNSGITLTHEHVQIGFTIRQWRTGSNNTVNEVWTFGWKIGGILNDHTPGNWTSLASFNLNEILTSTTSSTNVDGTASGNFFTVNLTTFTGLTWNAGETLHIRWADADDLGSDAGLAIDDFTMSVIPEPATWSLLVASLGLYAIWERRRKSRLNQKTSVPSRKDLI